MTVPTPSSAPITIVHVEYDPRWVEMLASTMAGWSEVSVLCSCARGVEGVKVCLEKKPDIAVIELGLPDIDGFAVAKELKEHGCPSRILILTARADEATLFHLGDTHIAGMLWKAPKVADLLRPALAAIHAGHPFYDPQVMHALREFRGASNAFFKILSDRELSLLSLFGEGSSDHEIAAEVGLSHSTIHTHRENIKRKLNLRGTPKLVRWANAKGFVTNPLRYCPSLNDPRAQEKTGLQTRAEPAEIPSSRDFQLFS